MESREGRSLHGQFDRARVVSLMLFLSGFGKGKLALPRRSRQSPSEGVREKEKCGGKEKEGREEEG